MEFFWEMEEKDYNEMIQSMNKAALDGSTEDDYYGCVRTGEICVDILAAGSFLEYSLFVGGIDTGYGYSSREAMEIGNYKTKYDVPDDLMYPYDHVDYFSGFGLELNNMSFDEFKRKTEEKIIMILDDMNKEYNEADLIAEANKPLHVW